MSNSLAKKGIYMLTHPHKYIGPITEGGVLYRSTWEERMMYYMDNNSNVVEWGSENIVIPYVFSLDGKIHKYYPDIVAKINTKDGIKTFIIEIKPYKQTIEPEKPKNRSIDRKRKYEQNMFVYVKNIDKWKYAKEYAEKNNATFLILTENEIYNKS